MTDDLRDQIAIVVGDYCADEDTQYALTDAILARFAVAGPLPEPDTRYHYPNADRWVTDETNDPIVYLAANGQIDFAGPGYWNTRKGDDPRPFAAAIIAAWQKAQEQSHARWEAGHGKR